MAHNRVGSHTVLIQWQPYLACFNQNGSKATFSDDAGIPNTISCWQNIPVEMVTGDEPKEQNMQTREEERYEDTSICGSFYKMGGGAVS